MLMKLLSFRWPIFPSLFPPKPFISPFLLGRKGIGEMK
jgi:hypothetical protein